MLGLLKPTDPRWVSAVEDDLDRLLADHAHCEMKAAQSALSLVGRHGAEHPQIIEPLLALAKEETDHICQVHEKITARGGRLDFPRVDEYVSRLQKAAKQDRSRIPVLQDRLLVGALIEARSCERFKLLADHLQSEELRGFYRDLMSSEARHYRLFTTLAEDIFGVETTRQRMAELAEYEAAILEELPLEAVVHG